VKKIPQEVIDDLMNDEDFLSLDEAGQDEILAGIQAKLGVTDRPENILQKVAKAGQSFQDFSDQAMYGATNMATFGLPDLIESKTGFKMSPGEPEGTAQHIGRGIGDVAGFAMGGPEALAGKVGGKIANPLLRGMAKGGVGMAGFSPVNLAKGDSSLGEEATKIGAGAGIGGALESVFPAVSNAFFRKNISKEKADALGSELGKIKESIKSNPSSTHDATGLWVKLKDIYDKAAPEVQRKLGSMKRWIDDIESQGGNVHPDFIRQMEEELGSQAKFHAQKGGFFQFLQKPKSPGANRALQEGRTAASGDYDVIAQKAGYPEFPGKSKELSGILKKMPDDDPSKVVKNLGVKVASAIAGTAVTGNPLVGLGIFLSETAAQNPQIKQGLYKAVSGKKGQNFLGGLAKAQRVGAGTTIQKL